jgi:hypothetical protein
MTKRGSRAWRKVPARALALAALAFVALPATIMAQPTGKITEFGIYGEDNALVKKTREISAARPVRFGFCFEAKVVGGDGGIMLVETLKHPPVMQANGIESTGYSMPRMFDLKGGVAKGCAGYYAKTPAALRPGTWRFTLSDGGDDVVVQEFIVK